MENTRSHMAFCASQSTTNPCNKKSELRLTGYEPQKADLFAGKPIVGSRIRLAASVYFWANERRLFSFRPQHCVCDKPISCQNPVFAACSFRTNRGSLSDPSTPHFIVDAPLSRMTVRLELVRGRDMVVGFI